MSSPFVEEEFITFKYPAPLDKEQGEDETEAAYEARLEKINPEEEPADHWVRVRVPKSRADVDKVADLTASRVIAGDNGDGVSFQSRIARGNKGIFELLVDSWSFSVRPDGSAYDKLGDWAGDWIIHCLAEATERGSKRDWAVKNGGSSKKPEPSVSEPSSAEPAASV